MKNRLHTHVLLTALILIAALAFTTGEAAAQEKYPAHYFYVHSMTYEKENRDMTGYVVSNVIRVDCEDHTNHMNTAHEITISFRSFFNSYYSDVLGVSQRTCDVSVTFDNKADAERNRQNFLDMISDGDHRGIYLVEDFVHYCKGGGQSTGHSSRMNSRYIARNRKRDERNHDNRDRDRDDREDRDRPEVTIFTSVNRFTGEVVRTTNWAEKREWVRQLAAKDPTGHIEAGMVRGYGGIEGFKMPKRKNSSGGKRATANIASAIPWVKQGAEKNNTYCQFIMAYSTVKTRLRRGTSFTTINKVENYIPVVKLKPEEAFKLLHSVIEKKDSAPKYYLRGESVDFNRGYVPELVDYSIYTCAMLIIADMYEQGVGVEKNAAEAARWRKLAIVEYQAENAAIAAFKKTTSELTMGLEK